VRVRYWARGARTAWILEEIGKTQPITTGIVVDQGAIARIAVLVYRESHGWEVRYPFFTTQFKGATLSGTHQLDRSIDGISGATLSVRALTRLARVALLLMQSPGVGPVNRRHPAPDRRPAALPEDRSRRGEQRGLADPLRDVPWPTPCPARFPAWRRTEIQLYHPDAQAARAAIAGASPRCADWRSLQPRAAGLHRSRSTATVLKYPPAELVALLERAPTSAARFQVRSMSLSNRGSCVRHFAANWADADGPAAADSERSPEWITGRYWSATSVSRSLATAQRSRLTGLRKASSRIALPKRCVRTASSTCW
jgi:hypothetical protein